MILLGSASGLLAGLSSMTGISVVADPPSYTSVSELAIVGQPISLWCWHLKGTWRAGVRSSLFVWRLLNVTTNSPAPRSPTQLSGIPSRTCKNSRDHLNYLEWCCLRNRNWPRRSLSWCHIFKWSHSFEDGHPSIFIDGCPIFKWVAETWVHDRVPG